MSRTIHWKGFEDAGGEAGWREVGGSRWVGEGSPALRGQSWSLVSLEETAEADVGREFAGRQVFVGAGRRAGLAETELLPPGILRGRSLSEP